mgnify:CR=1 FL=1
MNLSTSLELLNRAVNLIPGGVNSPVRACKSVGADPVFIDRAEGCLIFDADGNRYIDYVGSWGPMILGHAHPEVIEAVGSVIHKGLSFGAPTELESQMADKVCELVPSMDMVRMVSSGTEATMSAIRLARGFTGRDKIVKFEGCYHGHSDSLLVKAGSGALTLGVPAMGVPGAALGRRGPGPGLRADGGRPAQREAHGAGVDAGPPPPAGRRAVDLLRPLRRRQPEGVVRVRIPALKGPHPGAQGKSARPWVALAPGSG